MVHAMQTADFSLAQTLECGQCFRYEALEPGGADSRYFIMAAGKAVVAEQTGAVLSLYCEEADLAGWRRYFDLDRDYGAIKAALSAQDSHLAAACRDKWGIHLLRQDPFEMLITFILSQNKQIPHIMKLVEALAAACGEPKSFRAELDGRPFTRRWHAFPSPEALASLDEAALRELKTGFRAPYIVDAVRRVLEDGGLLGPGGTLKEKRERLMAIKGVGRKVADCVLLFGMGEYGAFPVDVWVDRIMGHCYGGPVDGEKAFGELAGFAQQYLFYHARDGKIGKQQK